MTDNAAKYVQTYFAALQQIKTNRKTLHSLGTNYQLSNCQTLQKSQPSAIFAS